MPKNVVVCCDGTRAQFGAVNTNVVHLFEALERHSGEQEAFYDPGVGTFAPRILGFPLGRFLGKALGAAFGYGMRRNLEDAYRFLMETWEPGDRVYLFGFSRGAFTARSLAAMLDKCGLLWPHHDNLLPYASRQFLKRGNDAEAADFRRTFARECRPHFVGVWDTVGSLGWLVPLRRLHDRRLSPAVSIACQALAIDEKRRGFAPVPWDEVQLRPHQSVDQVWFAGVHCDVGGGYRERGLADLSLRWMLDHARQAGLRLAPGVRERLDGDPCGRLHRSCKGWWRLLGAQLRPIARAAQIHPSVWLRVEAGIGYAPASLSRITRTRATDHAT
ncbi:MAG TPA: DUF2235 domain-containing protein [Gammaproteobacteria bacterium]|nr:DUF2235 domain-containing protein [Gammaproteobacteria bacterium]